MYKDKSFVEAEKNFAMLVAKHPDQKIYSIYQERSSFFIENPPDDDWNKVFTHTS